MCSSVEHHALSAHIAVPNLTKAIQFKLNAFKLAQVACDLTVRRRALSSWFLFTVSLERADDVSISRLRSTYCSLHCSSNTKASAHSLQCNQTQAHPGNFFNANAVLLYVQQPCKHSRAKSERRRFTSDSKIKVNRKFPKALLYALISFSASSNFKFKGTRHCI